MTAMRQHRHCSALARKKLPLSGGRGQYRAREGGVLGTMEYLASIRASCRSSPRPKCRRTQRPCGNSLTALRHAGLWSAHRRRAPITARPGSRPRPATASFSPRRSFPAAWVRMDGIAEDSGPEVGHTVRINTVKTDVP